MDLRIDKTSLPGLLVLQTPCFRDERGFLLESYNHRRFAAHGLTKEFVQDNHSRSLRHVLRGFHYQGMRAPMDKLVRCTAGSVYDVAVDLRVGSPTFGRHFGLQLSAESMTQMFIPVGFGHAFLTLSEVAEVQYKCSGYYEPSTEGTIAWNDSDIDVDWPVKNPLLSPRDEAGKSLRDYMESPAFHWQG